MPLMLGLIRRAKPMHINVCILMYINVCLYKIVFSNCVEFPTLCYCLRNLFICRREQSVCHMVSSWCEDWV